MCLCASLTEFFFSLTEFLFFNYTSSICLWALHVSFQHSFLFLHQLYPTLYKCHLLCETSLTQCQNTFFTLLSFGDTYIYHNILYIMCCVSGLSLCWCVSTLRSVTVLGPSLCSQWPAHQCLRHKEGQKRLAEWANDKAASELQVVEAERVVTPDLELSL